jgi:hypothetical protein
LPAIEAHGRHHPVLVSPCSPSSETFGGGRRHGVRDLLLVQTRIGAKAAREYSRAVCCAGFDEDDDVTPLMSPAGENGIEELDCSGSS